MRSVPRISDTEWVVMKAIWSKGRGTAIEILEELRKIDKTWHPKTLKTLLGRLVFKKALGFEKTGRTYVYVPKVTEDECAGAASESFLSRVFGGSLQPMLAHFVEKNRLSKTEIEALKRILDKK